MLEVPPHGLREHQFLEVATLSYQLVDVVPVGDASHVLLDDRPIIEHRRRVVGCGANELNAPRVRLMIGFAAGERRKEGVMNIDHRPTKMFEEFGEVMDQYSPGLTGFSAGLTKARLLSQGLRPAE